MVGQVAYISDQKFFFREDAWFTTASLPLDYIFRELRPTELVFWGRLYRVNDTSRLFPILAPPGYEGRLRFEGPWDQAAGLAGYASGLLSHGVRLRRMVRNAAIVWLKLPFAYSLVAQRFCRADQVVVTQMVGDPEEALGAIAPRLRPVGMAIARLCRRASARADIPAFVSRYLAAKYGGGRRDVLISNESRVTDNLILANPSSRREGALRLVFVGRLSAEKRVADLVTALVECPEVQLSIVGDGAERGPLEKLCANLSVADRVTWAGYVAWGPELFNLLGRHDALVLPSATEGLPLVIIEAMSQGVPSVATMVGGIPEIVQDGVSGLLVERDRPDQLVVAFQRLASEPGLLARLSLGALAAVKKHTLEQQLGPLIRRMRDDAGRRGRVAAA